ncbi:[Fe-Fe] hydrogenase large subunit C-terminal domain-containing protein [Clostridium kluyveri]|uniref:Iron hydrogenase n=1 Tax=Clostridium kluyveri TaxID=1534 RepID=A0A1L5F3G5_CLOKL|nr:[Fe-Fe] hydrogenase large subunit C-terminal domain-containing protein [Clostridium kluyveri]APM37492.1 iron hydrogenase [Clostridium kluyveri]UZQ52548.1 4Fe-4S binding protein [Clostridium kluyveri]
MKDKYRDLFKLIVKSYYDENFEETVEQILSEHKLDKEEFCKIISSLCGTNITYSSNFMEELKKAIKSYNKDEKIINKVTNCSQECKDGDKTLCEKSCPFDAIFIHKGKNRPSIDKDKCTDCGFCVDACPNGSIMDTVQFLPLANILKSDSPVIAIVAPAITGQFGDNVTMEQLRASFKKIGFTDMIEVAFFADMLTLKEAVEFDSHVKDKKDLIITSCCCPMWVGMLRRKYNNLVKHVSPSVSPMTAGGRVLKKLNPECKVVFIGPCIAKKAEAKEKDIIGDIDFVLTFTETKDIFDALNIDPSKIEGDVSTEYASKGGRLYARTGGVSIAVGEAVEKMFPEKKELFKSVQASGVKECKELLSRAEKGEISANFIEGMGCIGGCVGGPKVLIPKEKGRDKIDAFAENSEIKVSIDSKCMDKILELLDINSLEDFKNVEKIELLERRF